MKQPYHIRKMADKQVEPPPPYPGHLSPPAPAPVPVLPAAGKNDPEAANVDVVLEGFSDKAIRRNFMRKVYSILMVQLLITGAIISCFLFIDSLKT